MHFRKYAEFVKLNEVRHWWCHAVTTIVLIGNFSHQLWNKCQQKNIHTNQNFRILKAQTGIQLSCNNNENFYHHFSIHINANSLCVRRCRKGFMRFLLLLCLVDEHPVK